MFCWHKWKHFEVSFTNLKNQHRQCIKCGKPQFINPWGRWQAIKNKSWWEIKDYTNLGIVNETP